MGDLWDIGAKEVHESFSSRKFILLLVLFLLFSLGSVFIGLQNYQDSLQNFKTGDVYGDAPTKPSLIDVFQPMLQLSMPLAAALLAIILSYDNISKERESGTIELLLSNPIYRDEIINGKVIADLFIVSIALIIAFMTSSGYAIYSTGILPTFSEFFRIFFLWFGTITYMGFFIGLGTLLSTLFRSRWRSLIVSILLLFAFLATPFIAGIAASQIYKQDDTQYHNTAVRGHTETTAAQEEDQGMSVYEKRRKFSDTVSKYSPATSYRKYAESMLATDYNQQGAKPSVRESFNAAIGYLIYLLGQTAVVFTMAYTAFMRQDL